LTSGIFQNGLYFSTYEILKHKMSNGGELSVGKTIVAGGLTGIINWSFVLPLDVIKSRIQTGMENLSFVFIWCWFILGIFHFIHTFISPVQLTEISTLRGFERCYRI